MYQKSVIAATEAKLWIPLVHWRFVCAILISWQSSNSCFSLNVQHVQGTDEEELREFQRTLLPLLLYFVSVMHYSNGGWSTA